MIETNALGEMDQLLARLWVTDPAPTTEQMMKLMSLTTLDDEAQCESIRILMSRCSPNGDEIVSLLEAHPAHMGTILGWTSVVNLTTKDDVKILGRISDSTMREWYALNLLKSKYCGVLSQEKAELIVEILQSAPRLQEHVWKQMEEISICNQEGFLRMVEVAPRLRERIAQAFVKQGKYIPGLALALSIPSITSAAVGKLFELGKPEGLIEIALSNEVGDPERHKASARLMNVEEKTPRMMYAVMAVERNAEGFSRALDTFLALIQQHESKDDIPLIRECLELIDGMDVKWECLNGSRGKLQDILDRLTRPSETEEVLQAIQQLVAPQSI